MFCFDYNNITSCDATKTASFLSLRSTFVFQKKHLTLQDDALNDELRLAVNTFKAAVGSVNRYSELAIAASRACGLSYTEGYAVFENKVGGKLLAYHPGVAPGGYLLILDEVVVIMYCQGATFFKVVKQDLFTIMNISFVSVTPTNYRSLPAAEILNAVPTGVVATSFGAFSSYKDDVMPTCGITFQKAIFSNRQPVALFGIKTGNIAPRFIPTSRKGVASYILAGRKFRVSSRDYRETEDLPARGIVLDSETRAAVNEFRNSFKNGDPISLNWCRAYEAPSSAALTVDAELQIGVCCDEDEYNAQTTTHVIFFSADADKPDGTNVREWINGGGYEVVDYIAARSGYLRQILDQYHDYLRTLLLAQASTEAAATEQLVKTINRQCSAIKPLMGVKRLIDVSDDNKTFLPLPCKEKAPRPDADLKPFDNSQNTAYVSDDDPSVVITEINVNGLDTQPLRGVLPLKVTRVPSTLIGAGSDEALKQLNEITAANLDALETVSDLLEPTVEAVCVAGKKDEDGNTVVADTSVDMKTIKVSEEAVARTRAKVEAYQRSVDSYVVNNILRWLGSNNIALKEVDNDLMLTFRVAHDHWWPGGECTCYYCGVSRKFGLSGYQNVGHGKPFACGSLASNAPDGDQAVLTYLKTTPTVHCRRSGTNHQGLYLDVRKGGGMVLCQSSVDGINDSINEELSGVRHVFVPNHQFNIDKITYTDVRRVNDGVSDELSVSGIAQLTMPFVPVYSTFYGLGNVTTLFSNMLAKMSEHTPLPGASFHATVAGVKDWRATLERSSDSNMFGGIAYERFEDCDNWKHYGAMTSIRWSERNIPGTNYDLGPVYYVTVSFANVTVPQTLELKLHQPDSQVRNWFEQGQLETNAVIHSSAMKYLVALLDRAGVLHKVRFFGSAFGSDELIQLSTLPRISKFSLDAQTATAMKEALQMFITNGVDNHDQALTAEQQVAIRANIAELDECISVKEKDKLWYRTSQTINKGTGVIDYNLAGVYALEA